MKKNIAIVFGGCSSEYEVSLVSATSVIRNINKDKYNIFLIGITKSGDWYLYNGDIEKIETNEWIKENNLKISISTNRSDHGLIVMDTKEIINIDLVLPILHGKNGEDGRLQGMLELVGIRYAGCDMASSLLCMDKYLAHELVAAKGIISPKSYLFDNNNINIIKEKISDLEYPIFVKPLKAGSSFGISKVFNDQELEMAVREAFKFDNKIIIEENIEGFEVGCAVLGNNELTVGEVDEIELEGGFFNYFEKYNLKTSKIHLPARIEVSEREKIKKTALEIYKILGCSGFARVDMFYTKNKKIVFNEVNTIPGCTSHSRYPSMLNEIGISFSEIIDEWIRLGLEK